MPYNQAADKFGLRGAVSDTLVSDRAPYLKYTWVASFEFDDSGQASAEPGNESSGSPSGNTAANIRDIVLKSFELPRWSTDTQIINVYNHKTIVQTKLNFEPITISFYDQQNQAAETLIWDFVKGQFDPNDASKKAARRPLKVTVKLHTTSAGALKNSDQKTYILGQAYIVDAQHDTLDYATSDVVLWTITIRYETLDWIGGFEGEPPKVSTGIPRKEKPPKPVPVKKPPPPYTEPIPDHRMSPSMMDMMDGNLGGDVDYAAVNHKPVGLSKVLDEQRSRERARKTQSAPGANDTPAYSGYQSALVPTPPGPNSQGFNASSGATGQQTNSGRDTGIRRVETATASENSTVKKEEPRVRRTTVTATSDPGGVEGARARNEARRQIQDHDDAVKAQQTGQTVEQVRLARSKTMRQLDNRTSDF